MRRLIVTIIPVLFICSVLVSPVSHAQAADDQTGSQTPPPAENAEPPAEEGPPAAENPPADEEARIENAELEDIMEDKVDPQTPAAEAPAEEPAADQGTKGVEEIVVVGSRRVQDRSVLEAPVGVDFLQMDQVADAAGQLDINQLLQYVAPSFNSNRQSGADGADHIDPATLRGLGPDQTLVLINGKRRHQSSLINIFGSRGRGNTGTDLNTIPVAAIERIEILRDGAAAQYGSDAIAGVVNIVLKSDVEKFTANVNAGFRNAKPPSKYDVKRGDAIDGETLQINGNYGVKVLDTGFLNVTLDYLTKERTNRPADPDIFDIYRRQYGDAKGTNFSAFFNGEVPLGKETRFYAFGGYNFRNTDAYAWSRDADGDNNIPEIYPNGFDPHITSRITDKSISTGMRTKFHNWSIDIDNTFGVNRFHYIIDGTLNASLLEASPTRFDAGGHQLSQNTTGLHVSRYFHGFLDGLNLAFGAEHRLDNYQIFAGEEGSYRNYGIVETVVDGEVVPINLLDPARPAGSQGFPGFQPQNEVDENRTNIAAYLDTEIDVIENVLMVGLAGRAEHYSDFGNTVDGKAAFRWTVYDDLDVFNVALRGAVSSGFRAPSLAQKHYSTLFTDFVSGVAVDKIIAKNDSPITRQLGIPQLEEEKSINASGGLVMRYDMLSLTVDGYYVKIKDRIVLTGAFSSDDEDIGEILTDLNVSAAQFFTNALDTQTIGVDIILSSMFEFGEQHTLGAAIAANFNQMELQDVKTHDKLAGKEDIYFGNREKHFLLASAPKFKANLTLDYGVPVANDILLNVYLRGVYFDEVVLIDWIDEEDVYEAAFTLDAAVGVDLFERVSLIVGGSNLLNTYPTQQDTETETGGLWDAVQMGANGSFYYAKLGFTY